MPDFLNREDTCVASKVWGVLSLGTFFARAKKVLRRSSPAAYKKNKKKPRIAGLFYN